MSDFLRSTVLMSLLFLPCRLVLAEEASCSTNEGFEDGSSRGVDLKLKLDQDHPTGIEFEADFFSGQEGGAYSCHFDSRAADHKSVWTQGKDKVEVRILQGSEDGQDPEKESSFEISRTKDGFLVTFTEMSRTYCGFGAEYPGSVRLVKGKKACAVVFP